MKKIDSLLIKTFVPPFILALGVVMFVYTMQMMWKFIDDIIGKGASIGMIIEFVFYLSIGLLPMALPAAILLSSTYIMGNLSERYELTSMKSAGISLWRIMWPLIASCLVITAFSFLCSNNIAPTANLKFKTRLYNFKSQKLALSLSEGIFNDDFRNYSIRIGEKDNDSGYIKDVTLYDHSLENRNRTKIITAKEGNINMESDERFMIMELEDGKQYQEMEEKKSRKPTDPRSYPFLRIEFGELEKYLDLSEFEMKDMKEDLFKDQEQMLSIRQLVFEMDTMLLKMEDKRDYLCSSVSAYFHFVKTSDSTSYYIPMAETYSRKNNKLRPSKTQRQLNLEVEESKKESQKWRKNNKPDPTLLRPVAGAAKPNKTNNYQPNKKATKKPPKKITKTNVEPKLIEAKLFGEPKTFDEIFMPKHKKDITSRSASAAKGIKDKAKSNFTKIENLKAKRKRYDYQIHLKFSLALACMIFLFIGAPLGAIIRKGGFGYPILFGVSLFVFFVAMNTVFKKLGDNGSLPHPALAAWIPTLMFFIPCFFLTRGAVRDAKAISSESMKAWMRGLNFLSKFMT